MLPVSAWPPGPPGASLSPFGKPHVVNLSCQCGGFCILPTGAWVVHTGANQVMMFVPSWRTALQNQPTQALGTGYLPGQPGPPGPTAPTHDQYLESWRAWQRQTGINWGPIQPRPGSVPPNFGGWKYVPAPSRTLVQPNSAGLVIADGENVVLTGSGCATLIQAYSV